MKRDKTTMSTAVLHMLKMQIKAETNQIRRPREPSMQPKTPTQKKHFNYNYMETTEPALQNSHSKKHFNNLTFSESPHGALKQRRHFPRVRDTMELCLTFDSKERCHPMIQTAKAQTRIHIDLSE